MHGLYMALEMLQVREDKPWRLADWVIACYPGLWIFPFEVDPFNVVHHLRRAADSKKSAVRLFQGRSRHGSGDAFDTKA